MRGLLLPFILLFVLSSCEPDKNGSVDESESESPIDSRFETCYFEHDLAKNRADSVLITIFGKGNFAQFIRFDLAESSMNCQVGEALKLVPFGDTNYCIPNSYDLCYSLLQNGQPIFEFRLLAGKDMQFEAVSTIVGDQLRGYRNLLNGDFKISFSDARKIAEENGVDFNESNLELVKNDTPSAEGKVTYHWEAELEYDHNSVVLLWIDVMTGKTRKEVLRIENIE